MTASQLLTEATKARDDLRLGQSVRQRVGIGTLADLLSVHRIKKQGELNQRLVRKLQDGTVGEPEAGENAEGDDMGDTINVGDTFMVGREAPTKPPKRTGISPWWLALPTAAALGLGALSLLKPPEPQPPPTIEIPPDTNTTYDLQLAEPVEPNATP